MASLDSLERFKFFSFWDGLFVSRRSVSLVEAEILASPDSQRVAALRENGWAFKPACYLKWSLTLRGNLAAFQLFRGIQLCPFWHGRRMTPPVSCGWTN